MDKKVCIVPGSYDPVTNGHVFLVEKALEKFDKVYVGLLVNENKQSYFTKQQKLDMMKIALEKYDRTEIIVHDGLMADLARSLNAVSVRGYRDEKDLAYEKDMDIKNSEIYPEFETVLIKTDEKYKNISSTMVRELIKQKKDIKDFVPEGVEEYIRQL